MNTDAINDIRKAAEACTPLDFDSAQKKAEGGYVECLMCGGDGEVQLEADYLNFDGAAIGVQFYGIGNQHGAAERYLRALPPATVLELCRLAEIGERVERGEYIHRDSVIEAEHEADEERQ